LEGQPAGKDEFDDKHGEFLHVFLGHSEWGNIESSNGEWAQFSIFTLKKWED
jgi:hypothetical protein